MFYAQNHKNIKRTKNLQQVDKKNVKFLGKLQRLMLFEAEATFHS
jgi:hypothetical protein